MCMFCKLSIWDLAFTYLADTYLGFGKYMFGMSASTTEEFMAGPFLVERFHIQVKVFRFFLWIGISVFGER